MSDTRMDKAAREKARELCESYSMRADDCGRLSKILLQALDALDAADSDTARLQARISELLAEKLRITILEDWKLNKAADETTKLQARVSELEAALSRGVDSVMIGTAGEAYARVNSSGANIGAIRAALEAVFPAPPVGDR